MKKMMMWVAVAVLTLGAGVRMKAQDSAAKTPAAATIPEDQQPTDAQLDRLLDVLRVKDQVAAMTKTMQQAMQSSFEQQIKEMQAEHPEMAKMTPEQQKKYGAAMGRFMGQAMTLYTSDEMMNDLKNVYRKHISQSDVENIITFYTSSSGQRILDMMPVIMQEYVPMVMEKTQARVKPLVEELQKELAQIEAPDQNGAATPQQK